MMSQVWMKMLVSSLVVFGFAVSAHAAAMNGMELLPPNAKPGECYAKVFVPPSYKEETEQVLVKEAYEKIEIIPAQYEWVEEKVLVKEASEKIEVIPAEYETVEEKVMVKPASEKLEVVPAEFATVEERVMDQPAHVIWKPGRGLIERVDYATGEIMCLVEVPATFKTIKKQVVKTPVTVKKTEVPAEYVTIKKRVVKTPATTRKVEIPAEYKTVKVQKLVTPAQEKRIPVPAEYQTITKRIKVSEGRMEWQAVLCETNVTPEIVKNIQSALLNAGYNPGQIDGALGVATMSAVESFQKDKGLPVGNLTMETLRALGVQLR